jgi:protein-disulfide isomerase
MQIQDALDGDLRFVFRNFPLSQSHPHAMGAAAAAEAAALQGRFWEMHDMLYENQDSLDERSLLAYADALNLDLARFAEDLTSPEVQELILSDQYDGARSGVNATPTFYVNGARYDGDWSYAPFLEFLLSLLRHDSEEADMDQAG